MMYFLKDNESGETKLCAAKPEWINGIWECGDWRMTDPTGTAFEAIEETVPPKVGPIHFQMLFTSEEGGKADELRATDKTLARFWKLVDDPRTDVIDLGLQSVQDAVEYTLAVVRAAGVDVDIPTRKAEILTGVLR